MSASDILVPPSEDDQRDAQQRTFWVATHERMERFLPGFLGEVIVIPEMPPTPSTSGRHVDTTDRVLNSLTS